MRFCKALYDIDPVRQSPGVVTSLVVLGADEWSVLYAADHHLPGTHCKGIVFLPQRSSPYIGFESTRKLASCKPEHM
jgi:hypothetical protein